MEHGFEGASEMALERGASGAAYNIADDEPASFSDLITAAATALDAPQPLRLPSWLLNAVPYAKAVLTGGLRVSNYRAKHELGWTPRTTTYRDGIADLASRYEREAA